MNINLNYNEKLADIISTKINAYTKKDKINYLKMKYGIEIFLINFSKMLLVFSISFFSKTFLQTSLMVITFWILRKSSFGLHSKKSFICTLISLFMFNAIPIIVKHFYINKYVIFFTVIVLSVFLIKYSPAETEGHPILNKDKLKKIIFIKCMVLTFIILIIPNNYYRILLACTLLCQVMGVLPITYKLLKRRYYYG